MLSEEKCPAFIGEPGIGDEMLVLEQLVAVFLGYVISNDIVLGSGE